MKLFCSTLLATTVLLAAGSPAGAQSPVTIQFQDGRVSITAKRAPLRTILAEWSRVGGSKIVNGERVGGEPVTLELTNVPEREALRVLLRNLGGYMAAARPAGSAGASMLDRIMVIPTPAPMVAAQPTAPAGRMFTATPMAPAIFSANDAFEDQFEDAGQRRPPANVSQTQALRDAAAAAAAARANEGSAEAPPAPSSTPGVPGGTVRGSSRPGEITPAPQPRRPGPEEP